VESAICDRGYYICCSFLLWDEPVKNWKEPIENVDEDRDNGNETDTAKTSSDWYQGNKVKLQSMRGGSATFIKPKTQGNQPARNQVHAERKIKQ
jgi:hypothetical protein